ncbi:Blue light- and temperature-regulated antirepressor YcgF [Gimesia alba]|uniref:Blue light-and temperature-regulated antirepressor YcgF n=1 Tax=Gimesia alba TaxID=2527973 RepID=A0A517RMQ4_9PLAN|nr:BLUF domain-containing protein [Gimesia alba]QDT45167.1 Blue light- and temperature-regulated antirepressor YcgF [Gimesia alba]
MKLYQLIYVSKSVVPMSKEGLNEILGVACRNNATQEITGVLVYDRGHFFQVLEGERDDVESVFSKIQKDNRHYQINRIISDTIKKRFFPNWNMGLYNMDDCKKIDFYKLKRCMTSLHEKTTVSEKRALAKYALRLFMELKKHRTDQSEDQIQLD